MTKDQSWAVFTNGDKLPLFCVHAPNWPEALDAARDELVRRGERNPWAFALKQRIGTSDLETVMIARMR